MAEIDYQMALLLQHRFEQEDKATKNAQASDQELARQLQEQFEQEVAVEKPTSNLVYEQPKTAHNSSRSLTDPSWELVDPTPDIHNLFMVFNERFFWNKLLAVCVSWSKRMTSCAGICAYNGKGGMCSITLSEPLLKLRPRKDLVETLLHEMIHAYLFVTHNNRDRDGHGPEFHKHMYRINKESGTNITVYHNFHDEVRLYKQHWWRCDGPCQHWKPYFGMVRRASNRAPGPNDRWWADHSGRCGGTFIKVKEPEKSNKKDKKSEGKGAKSAKNNTDIRDLIGGLGNRDHSNVKGFKDLQNTKVKGKSNSSSTIVVTKNTNTGDSSFKPTIFNASSGGSSRPGPKPSTSTGASPTDTHTDEFLSVRNHWANKFNNTNKRPASEEPPTSPKIQKVSDSNYCDCPVCNKKVLMSELNHHLDVCLTKTPEPELPGFPEEKKECPLCHEKIASSSFDVHVEKCLIKVYVGVEDRLRGREPEVVSCLACGKKIIKSELNSHLEDCMLDIFDVEVDGENDDKEANDGGSTSNSQFNCPFCMKLVEENEMKVHIDSCLKAENVDVLESLMDDDF